MVDATDVRLKEGRIVQTAGFYEAGDEGGATYMLSATESTGSIELSNGLYANIVLDTKVIDGKNGESSIQNSWEQKEMGRKQKIITSMLPFHWRQTL